MTVFFFICAAIDSTHNQTKNQIFRALRNLEAKAENGAKEGGTETNRGQEQSAGHLLKATKRTDEEGSGALCSLRRRSRSRHLLQPRQALRVL